jgi:hypothetical protein
LEELDVSGDGLIDYKEFMHVLAQKNQRIIVDEKEKRRQAIRKVILFLFYLCHLRYVDLPTCTTSGVRFV